MPLTIATEPHGPVLVFALTGSLDATTADALERQVSDALDGGTKSLLFDLTNLDYVSSVGLRVFLVAYRRLQPAGGKLQFCGLKPLVRQVFDITGMTARVEMYPGRAEALTARRG
jgi:anti-sigma B factor antagonist